MNQYNNGNGNWGNGYDEFGNPINMGVYGVNEHQMMHMRNNPGMSYGCIPPQQYGGYLQQAMHPQPGIYPQQGMCPQQGVYQQRPIQHQRATTKKDILSYIQNLVCPSEVEQISEFDTIKTRHICKGFKEIVLLDKQVVNVPTSSGSVGVEVFFCPRCRKLLINSQSLEIL